jgi:protein-L-isoaspartate(D-aspartate) O-methyltransferase
VLAYLATARHDRRRELGLVLAAVLLRAAGQDWYEQGDVWERVAAHRGLAGPAAGPRREAIRHLITAVRHADASPLAAAPGWPLAFQDAGHALADLAKTGTITRGLRAVLAHHVLFAWNRLGISAPDQHVLAAAARQAVFGGPPSAAAASAGLR